MQTPTEASRRMAHQMLRYLKGTASQKLTYQQNDKQSDAYVDASWVDGRSQVGYVVCVNGNPVVWKSVKIKVAPLSTTEAEVFAIVEGLRECEYLRVQLEFLIRTPLPIIRVWSDSNAALAIAKQLPGEGRERSKHFVIRKAFIHDLRESYEYQRVDTTMQLADMLTKSLPKCRLDVHLPLLHFHQVIRQRVASGLASEVEAADPPHNVTMDGDVESNPGPHCMYRGWTDQERAANMFVRDTRAYQAWYMDDEGWGTVELTTFKSYRPRLASFASPTWDCASPTFTTSS